MLEVYEVRPRKDRRGVDLVSDALPCSSLCSTTAVHATTNPYVGPGCSAFIIDIARQIPFADLVK